jgi:hypothetical protein
MVKIDSIFIFFDEHSLEASLLRYNIQSYPSGPELVTDLSLNPPGPFLYQCFYVGFVIIMVLRKTIAIEESELDPWTLFLNAMRAPMTRDRYKTRVNFLISLEYQEQL